MSTAATQFTHAQTWAMHTLLEDRTDRYGQETEDLHERIWDAFDAGKSVTLNEDERCTFYNAGTAETFWARVYDEGEGFYSPREMRTYNTMFAKIEEGLVMATD